MILLLSTDQKSFQIIFVQKVSMHVASTFFHTSLRNIKTSIWPFLRSRIQPIGMQKRLGPVQTKFIDSIISVARYFILLSVKQLNHHQLLVQEASFLPVLQHWGFSALHHRVLHKAKTSIRVLRSKFRNRSISTNQQMRYTNPINPVYPPQFTAMYTLFTAKAAKLMNYIYSWTPLLFHRSLSILDLMLVGK